MIAAHCLGGDAERSLPWRPAPPPAALPLPWLPAVGFLPLLFGLFADAWRSAWGDAKDCMAAPSWLAAALLGVGLTCLGADGDAASSLGGLNTSGPAESEK